MKFRIIRIILETIFYICCALAGYVVSKLNFIGGICLIIVAAGLMRINYIIYKKYL